MYTIFNGLIGDEFEIETASLGVQSNKVGHSFQWRNKGEFVNVLGIRMQKWCPNEFYLTQPGLREKAILARGSVSANEVNTSTTGKPVGADLVVPSFKEEWRYSSTRYCICNASYCQIFTQTQEQSFLCNQADLTLYSENSRQRLCLCD